MDLWIYVSMYLHRDGSISSDMEMSNILPERDIIESREVRAFSQSPTQLEDCSSSKSQVQAGELSLLQVGELSLLLVREVSFQEDKFSLQEDNSTSKPEVQLLREVQLREVSFQEDNSSSKVQLAEPVQLAEVSVQVQVPEVS